MLRPPPPPPVLTPPARANPSIFDEHPRHTFGPTVSLSFPHPLWVDLEKKFSRDWDTSVGIGGLGFGISTPQQTRVAVSVLGIDLRERYHPYHGAFFIGAALGYQRVDGSASQSFTISYTDGNGQNQNLNLNGQVQGEISSFYLTPQLGWIWVLKSGWVIGLDLGLQIPIHPTTTATLSTNQASIQQQLSAIEQTADYQQIYTAIQNEGNQLGGQILPYVTALRLGYFF